MNWYIVRSGNGYVCEDRGLELPLMTSSRNLALKHSLRDARDRVLNMRELHGIECEACLIPLSKAGGADETPLVRALSKSLHEKTREAVTEHYPALFAESAGATFEGGARPWIELWNGLDPDAKGPEIKLSEIVEDWLKELSEIEHARFAETCAACFDSLASACRKKAKKLRRNKGVTGAGTASRARGVVDGVDSVSQQAKEEQS